MKIKKPSRCYQHREGRQKTQTAKSRPLCALLLYHTGAKGARREFYYGLNKEAGERLQNHGIKGL